MKHKAKLQLVYLNKWLVALLRLRITVRELLLGDWEHDSTVGIGPREALLRAAYIDAAQM